MTIVESARAALIVAAKMAEDGMIPIAQTSGSKGIQVYAAIAPTRSKTAWSYVKRLNASLHKAQPDFFVSTMSIQQRARRIYVDYNQNLAAPDEVVARVAEHGDLARDLLTSDAPPLPDEV